MSDLLIAAVGSYIVSSLKTQVEQGLLAGARSIVLGEPFERALETALRTSFRDALHVTTGLQKDSAKEERALAVLLHITPNDTDLVSVRSSTPLLTHIEGVISAHLQSLRRPVQGLPDEYAETDAVAELERELNVTIDETTLAHAWYQAFISAVNTDRARGGVLAGLAEQFADDRLTAENDQHRLRLMGIESQIHSLPTKLAHEMTGLIARPRPTSWPVRVGTVPLLADCYQERSASARIEQVLARRRTAVLTGLGGVGKTQIAASYAEQQWDTGAIDLLVWVSAGSRQSIVTGYAEAATVIDPPGVGERDLHAAANVLLTWLRTTSRQWLIVLDDMHDSGDLRALWPPNAGNGNVLLTTRRRDAALVRQDRELIDVGDFTAEESLSYLHAKLADRPHLMDGSIELSKELGYLPLALAQATAFMLDRSLTAEHYRNRLVDRRKRLPDILPAPGELPDDHQDTVAATWSLSIEHADELAPTGMAHPLLKLLSLLDPNGVPAAVLTSEPVLDYTAAQISREISPSDVRDALHNLHRLSLVSADFSEHSSTIHVHTLVQRATRDLITESDMEHVAWVAADALINAWPDVESDRSLAATLRANTLTLIYHAEIHLWQPSSHTVLFRAGESLGESGLIRQAIAHYRHMYTIAVNQLGCDHSNTLGIRNNLATWRGESGEVTEAIEEFERLLADQIRISGTDDPLTLTIRNNISVWRASAGEVAKAIEDFERLLADQTTILNPDDHHCLRARANLASLRGETGNISAAIEEFEQLLADRQRVLGNDHPDTLSTRNELAHWRGEAGDPAGAAAELERLLADQIHLLGSDHPQTLTTLNNRAAARGYAGDVAGAISEFEQLLETLLRVLGRDHPHTLRTRSNLIFWRGQAGDNREAVAESKEILADRKRIFGPDHPDTLQSRSDLAHLQRDAGDSQTAIRELEQLLADRKRVLGPDHPDTFDTRNSLAGFRGESGDVAGAVEQMERLLADQLRVLSSDHPDILSTRNNLAGLRGHAGDISGAIMDYENLLESQIQIFGPDHPKTLAVRCNLAGLKGDSGNTRSAMEEFEQLVVDHQRLLGGRHPNTLYTRRLFAHWLGRNGDVLRAVAELEQLLRTSTRVLGPNDPLTAAISGDLNNWRKVAIYT